VIAISTRRSSRPRCRCWGLILNRIGLFDVEVAVAEVKRFYPGALTVGADLQCTSLPENSRSLVIEVVMNKVLSIVLLIAVVSGCSSVINNSERFYQEHPRRRINWREYMTD